MKVLELKFKGILSLSRDTPDGSEQFSLILTTGLLGVSAEELEVSDGYHTMSELYEHRIRLYLALVKVYDGYITPLNCEVVCWKSRLHDDGSSYEGWFLLGMTVTQYHFMADTPPEKWDISYHIPDKYWHLAKVMELPKAPPYDGYTSRDVLERLLRL